MLQRKLKALLSKSKCNNPLGSWIQNLETNLEVEIMLTRETTFKYRIAVGVRTLILAGGLAAMTSIVAAQKAPAKVATAQRETLLQTTQSWNGKPYTHYPIGQPQLTTLKVTIAPAVRHWSSIRGKPLRNRWTMCIEEKQATSRRYC